MSQPSLAFERVLISKISEVLNTTGSSPLIVSLSGPSPAIARDSVIVGNGYASAIVAGKVMLNSMVSGSGFPSGATMASLRLNPGAGLLQLSLSVSTVKVQLARKPDTYRRELLTAIKQMTRMILF